MQITPDNTEDEMSSVPQERDVVDLTRVVISRYWHHPQISYRVTNDSISLGTDVRDYLAALVEEIGNPSMIMTKKQLLERLIAASHAVHGRIKESSAA